VLLLLLLLLTKQQREGLLVLELPVVLVLLAGASLLRSLRAAQSRPRGGRAVRAWFAPAQQCWLVDLAELGQPVFDFLAAVSLQVFPLGPSLLPCGPELQQC